MLGGTELSTVPVGPVRPVSNLRADRERTPDAARESRDVKTPSEALEHRIEDPVESSAEAEATREQLLRDREPPVPPRVSFRELGTDDDGGPLVSVEGVPEAVYARPRFDAPEVPLRPDLSVYEAKSDRAAPGEQLDRLA